MLVHLFIYFSYCMRAQSPPKENECLAAALYDTSSASTRAYCQERSQEECLLRPDPATQTWTLLQKQLTSATHLQLIMQPNSWRSGNVPFKQRSRNGVS